MAGASLVDGMEVQVGYCSQTTAKLTVVALWDNGPLTVETAAGSASITTPLTGLGNDNPSRPGLYPLYYAHILISGLSPGAVVPYVVRKNGIEVRGSVRTLPSDTSPLGFLQGTCEHGEQFSPSDHFGMMRQYAETPRGVPTYFYVHVDDLWYVDSMRFFGFQPGFGQDSTTGLALTSTTVDPQDTGLAWDYCVSWLGYFGLLPSWKIARTADRLWWHRNMPMWAQWGDHEVASNWQRGHGGQGDWYGPLETPAYSADSDFSPVGTANFFANVAKPLWEALFGQCRPGVLRAGGQHWGASWGPCAWVAVDMNTYADGRHGLTTGSGAGTGRQADGSINAGSGTTALPYLGSAQIGDIQGYYQAQDKPFNFLFTANGISSHNEPWAQWWVSDFDDLMKRATTGLLNQTRLNGTTGKLCVLKGDSHALHVAAYYSDGSAGGLGGAAYNGPVLYEICPGTINGSATASVSFQYAIQGLRIHYLKSATSSRARHIHGFTHVEVRADLSPQTCTVRLLDTTGGSPVVAWEGSWDASVPGNTLVKPAQPTRMGF